MIVSVQFFAPFLFGGQSAVHLELLLGACSDGLPSFCCRAAPTPPPAPVQMEEDFIKANPEWVKELEIMVQTKVKAEIQALSSFGFQYLSQVYLPLKLQEGDWI